MCRIVDDELFDKVIVGEYWSEAGQLIKGAYSTNNDSAVVVNINLFERLLSQVKIIEGSSEITLEEAEKKFGDLIIQRYLAIHGVADIFSLEQIDEQVGDQIIAKRNLEEHNKSVTSSENLKSARKANVEKGNQTKAKILKLILEGVSQQEIMDNFGVGHGTVQRTLKSFTKENVRELWHTYRTSIFDGVDMKLLESFITDDCNYKKFRSRLVIDNNTVIRKSVEHQVAEMKAMREGEEHLKEYNTKFTDLGYKPINTDKEVEEAPKQEEDIFDKILAMNGVVEEHVAEMPKQEIKPEVDEYAIKYAEKMSSLGELTRSNYSLPTRKGFSPRPRTGISSVGAYNAVKSEIHTLEEI